MLKKVVAIIRNCVLKIKYGEKMIIKKSFFKSLICKSDCIVIKNGKLNINGKIYLKKNAHIGINGGTIIIGDNCFFNSNTICACQNYIQLGDRVAIGPNVCIYDHDHVFGESGKVFPDEYTKGSVKIGNNVWIGAGAIILKNTNIGDNTIIGAGSIVKGEIPANSLVTSDRKLLIKPLISKEAKNNERKK